MRIQREHIRVFLEGIEFKAVNSVTITEQIGSPPSCEITTSYKSRIHNVLPKTVCQVFYRYENDYILIFEGEYTGLTFEKNALQKACKLQFTGISLNWRNHYVVAKDTGSRFDRGAFIVANAQLPLTYSDESRHINQERDTDFNTWYETLIPNRLKAKNSTLTREDYVTILEKTAPKFRKDMFFALARREASIDLHFAVNTSNIDKYQREHLIRFSNDYVPILETQSSSYSASQLYDYNGFIAQSDSSRGDKTNSRDTETAWGMLQVMGFNFSHGLSQPLQKHLLITGLKYPEKVIQLSKQLPKNTLVNVDYPVFGKDFLCYKDTKTKQLFAIPSESLLFALQCKSAWGLLSVQDPTIDSGTYNYSMSNVLSTFARWLGKIGKSDAHGTRPEIYADEVYEYFKQANTFFYPENPAPSDVQNSPIIISYDEKSIKAAEYIPNWIKTFVNGGNVIAQTRTLLATELNSQDLPTLVSGIFYSLSLTSSYYSRVDAGFNLSSRLYVNDSESARKLFTLEGFAEFALQQASSQEYGIMSGMDMLNVFSNIMNYSIHEYAAPFSNALTNTIMTPDTTFMVPMLCNTFFSDQLNDFQFTRQIEQEPTRYVTFSNSMGLLGGEETSSAVDLRFSYVTPKIPDTHSEQNYIKGDKEKTAQAIRQYSYEETWRGVHPIQGRQNEIAFDNLLFNMFDTTDDTKHTTNTLDNVLNNPFASGFLNNYWTSMADGMFIKKRYETRNAVLTTVYNPNRLCGFPGIIIDDELPAVIGKIQSISSTISADGQSISQITMSHCHTHWDEDLEKPTVVGLGLLTTVTGVYNYMRDAIPSMDHIYKFMWNGKDSRYRWYNMGKEIYGPMLGYDVSQDYSILRYADTSLLDKQDEATNVVDWENYSKAIANSITNIRRVYNTFSDRHLFSDNLAKHNKLTYSNYWLSIIGETEITSPSKYAKDSLWLQEYQRTRGTEPSPIYSYYQNIPFSLERQTKISEFINMGLVSIEGGTSYYVSDSR